MILSTYVRIVCDIVDLFSYSFPCSRWLAKSNDDGSTERLLVAELQQKLNNNNNEGIFVVKIYIIRP